MVVTGSRRHEVPASQLRDPKVFSNRELETTPVRPALRLEAMRTAEVRGHGLRRMTKREIAGCRRQPEHPSPPCPPLQPSVLRHSDDQTITALAAVHSAIRQMGDCVPREFERWGILVASCFLGRSTLLAAFNRFDAEGVWGVSPHLIPHYALHSPAGTLSLALGIRGPSLGVGGGPGAVFEGLLAALSWLAAGVVPGLWLVQTAWSPELVPDPEGEPLGECECHALALALVPSPRAETTTMPAFRLVTSRVPRARLSLAIGELGNLLDRSTTRWPAEEPRCSARRPIHATHSGAGTPHPHFSRDARARPTTRTVACDASGRTRVELVLPRLRHVREDH